jgi:hypothetical protein
MLHHATMAGRRTQNGEPGSPVECEDGAAMVAAGDERDARASTARKITERVV